MSNSGETNELIRKFTAALTLLSDRSATLETRVLGELEGVRNDIKKLRKEVFDENAISIPQIMEQQRITMIELIRQMQPHFSSESSKPLKQESSQIVTTKQATPKHIQQELSEISICTATPKPETPKPIREESTRDETPKSETPKQAIQKSEAPKQAIQEPKTPKQAIQKPETPKQETPKPETPKPETPKAIHEEPTESVFATTTRLQATPKSIHKEPSQQEPSNQEESSESSPAAPRPSYEDPSQHDTPIQKEPTESMFATPTQLQTTPMQQTPTLCELSPISAIQMKEEKKSVSFTVASNMPVVTSPTQQTLVNTLKSQDDASTNLFSSPGAATPMKEEKKPVSFMFAPNRPSVLASIQSQRPSTGFFGTPKAPEQKAPVSFSFAPSFGTSKAVPAATQENKTVFGSAFQGNSNFDEGVSANSFASLAGNTGSTNTTVSTINTQTPQSKNFTAFRGKANSIDAQTSPQSFVPDDSQFRRPNSPMPGLGETKSGEENEDVLFLARCRLYRFLPGGNIIERGTGDIKILKHRGTGKTRCVMRPEIGLTLCANFKVFLGLTVKNMKSGENVLTWACHDYSDPAFPDGENTTLICRFNDVGSAMKFKQIVHSVTI